jgi:hypothetical protein
MPTIAKIGPRFPIKSLKGENPKSCKDRLKTAIVLFFLSLPQEQIHDGSNWTGLSGSKGQIITIEIIGTSLKGISNRGGDRRSVVHEYVPDDDVVLLPRRHHQTEAPSCAIGRPLNHLTDGDTRVPSFEGAVCPTGRIHGGAVADGCGQGGGHVDPGPIRSPDKLVAAERTVHALLPSGKSTTHGNSVQVLVDKDPIRRPPLAFGLAQEECKSSCSAPVSLTMESCKEVNQRLVDKRNEGQHTTLIYRYNGQRDVMSGYKPPLTCTKHIDTGRQKAYFDSSGIKDVEI